MSASVTWSGFSWPAKDAEGRTHQPVLKNSRRSLGRDETPSFITRRMHRALLKTFDRKAKAQRPKGVRRGGRNAFRGERASTSSWAAHLVLDYLAELAVNTGRVYPSYKHMGEVLGMAPSHACECVRQLVAMGFLLKERRLRPTGAQKGEAGPQVEQDTNWYRVVFPSAAAKMLDGWRTSRRRHEDPEVTAEQLRREATDSAVTRRRSDMRRKISTLENLKAAAATAADRKRIERQIAALWEQLGKDEAAGDRLQAISWEAAPDAASAVTERDSS